MKTISLSKTFGSFLSDGSKGYAFAQEKVIPLLKNGEKIALDFEDVENMTDSFANACLGAIFEESGDAVQNKRVIFIHSSEVVKSFILASFVRATKKKLSSGDIAGRA